MNRVKKLAAGLLSTVMVLSLTACEVSPESLVMNTTEVNDEEAVLASGSDLETTAVSLLKTHGSEEGKEETVYILADADGNVQKTIVSSWLKNPEEAASIEDVSNLSDIQNVEGDETFTQGTGNNLTWEANGSDIHYQGTSEAELPIDTTITYELDGKEVNAEQLAGATGHLKITFSYKNNVSKTEVIDNEKVTLYQPFLVISGMMVDSSKASNLTVTNGKIISTDSKSIVVGMAMPGLRESLGLDSLKDGEGELIDIDIPEEVTVEADVTDFSLLTTVTAYDNSALSELSLDDVNTIDDLKDSMDELTDASTKLVNGTSDLYDGVSELSDGVSELVEKTGQLNDGVKKLDSTLRTKMTDAEKASAEKAASDAVDSSYSNGKQTEIANQIYAGLRYNSDKTDGTLYTTLYNNGIAASKYANTYSTYESKVLLVLQGAASKMGAAISDNKDTEFANIQTAVSSWKTGHDAFATVLATAGSIDNAVAYIDANSAAFGGATGTQLATAYTAYETYAGLLNFQSASTMAEYLWSISADNTAHCSLYEAVYAGVEAAAATDASKAQAKTSVETALSTMSGTLAASTKTIAATAAKEAAVTAAETTKATVADSIEQVQSGEKYSLVSGMQALYDGVAKSTDSDKSLKDGVSELLDGSEELKDGMSEFDEEGINKLTDLVDSDLIKVVDRIKALRDYSKEYTSFSGCSDGTACSVKFIMRTDSIEATEEDK